jgi:hypothetical protein
LINHPVLAIAERFLYELQTYVYAVSQHRQVPFVYVSLVIQNLSTLLELFIFKVQDSFYNYPKTFYSFKKKDQAFISSCFEKDFNGSILVYKKNKLYKSVKGYADLDKNHKLEINDVFQMASVSKTITSIAILQLHQNGLIHLYTSITNFRLNKHQCRLLLSMV